MYFPVKPGATVLHSVTGIVVVSVDFRTGCAENEDVLGHDGRRVESARVRPRRDLKSKTLVIRRGVCASSRVAMPRSGLGGPPERFNVNLASWMVACSEFRWESGTNIEGFGLPTIESGWRVGARVSILVDADDGDGTKNTGKVRMG